MDEAWVRDEFNDEDVQHIINMRLDDNWIQAPRDIEVWIGKQKIVRVRVENLFQIFANHPDWKCYHQFCCY